jgi:hypothetical protein
MADRSQSPMAGQLLRGLAAVQRVAQTGPYTVGSVAGIENDMADNASRTFNHPNLKCDTSFLTHFTHRSPLPQQVS